MALPEIVRVKISSEAAGSITLSAVVVRDMPVRELIEAMLGTAGKNPARLHDLLRAGSLVSGESRFRWTGFDADPSALAGILATFPDPDPGRPFAAASCVRAVLKGPNARIGIDRAAASERRLFRRHSFWDALVELMRTAEPRYVGYSYSERADTYEVGLTADAAALLRESAAALRYSTLEAQIRQSRLDRIEFFVGRTA